MKDKLPLHPILLNTTDAVNKRFNMIKPSNEKIVLTKSEYEKIWVLVEFAEQISEGHETLSHALEYSVLDEILGLLPICKIDISKS